MIHGVQARGLDVTTESYPYTAGMTDISSARYLGWEKEPDSVLSDVVVGRRRASG